MPTLADLFEPDCKPVADTTQVWDCIGAGDPLLENVRTERRFDGPYGMAYDKSVTSPTVRSMWRTLGGDRAVLGRLDEIARMAFEHAPDEPLLDLPCGAGSSLVNARGVHRTGMVVGADLSAAMLRRAAARVNGEHLPFDTQLVRCNALDLPFRTATFGTALSVNGLHCMPDPALFLTNIARVVRPGGVLVMTTLLRTGSHANRIANDAFRRSGVIPSMPPTMLELHQMFAAAGFVDAQHLGGSTLVGYRCMRA